MIQSGRFETTTKTRIKTKYGTILKVITYDDDPDAYPDVEYKIRPICEYCGRAIECLCFNSENCDFPYEDALFNLQRCWICGSNTCLIKYQKESDPEYYSYLHANYNGNRMLIADHLEIIGSGDTTMSKKRRLLQLVNKKILQAFILACVFLGELEFLKSYAYKGFDTYLPIIFIAMYTVSFIIIDKLFNRTKMDVKT